MRPLGLNSSTMVLDASALLALLQNEPGADAVAAVLPSGVMSAVNLSEVVGKLVDHGMPADAIRNALDGLPIDVHAFDHAAAYEAGELRRSTRGAGISLGDRACLALAMRLGATALTADRAWASIAHTARVRVIR